jgi:TolB-like protein/Flp pilus assembly protein TadD
MKMTVASYSIDMSAREIRNGDAAVPVEPKVFDLLQMLIEHRARVVPKDEMIERLWDGRAISDAALSSCVKAARRALGDDGQRQCMIRTVARRGFRFVGPVRPATPEHDPIAGATAAACDAAAPPVAAAFGEFDVDLTLPKRPSIAVLPFQLLGGAEAHRVIADGLGTDITVRLARTRWLFVTARASAAQFRAPEVDPVEIGARLGVRYLLQGTIMVDADRLRLTAVLTDAVQGCEIWAERFDRRLDDVFAVQDEIGDLVVAAVESEIETKERQRALLQPLASLDAWSAYHRARHHLFRFRAEDYEEAERLLELAARLDPNSPRVFAALSFVHWQRAFLEIAADRRGALAQAFEHARHSLVLDPLDPQGHWVLGRAHILDGEIDRAVDELRTAVALSPNFANGHYSLAYALMFDGRSAEALPAVEQARRLSPYDPMIFAFEALRGSVHGLTGEVARAAEWTSRAIRQPNAHYQLFALAAWCHELAGRHDEAQRHLAALKAVRPDYCRADYFRAFPFRGRERAIIEPILARLGL